MESDDKTPGVIDVMLAHSTGLWWCHMDWWVYHSAWDSLPLSLQKTGPVSQTQAKIRPEIAYQHIFPMIITSMRRTLLYVAQTTYCCCIELYAASSCSSGAFLKVSLVHLVCPYHLVGLSPSLCHTWVAHSMQFFVHVHIWKDGT